MPERIWPIFRGVFMRDRRDATSRSPGQLKLLSAVRLQENKKMGDIIKAASIDDLEWFLQMLELQLEETPHWVKDDRILQASLAWTRRVRTMTTEVLHNKRVASRKTAWLRRNAEKIFYAALGGVVGSILTWWLGKG